MERTDFIKQLISTFVEAPKNTVAFSKFDGNTVVDITYNDFAKDIMATATYFIQHQIIGQHIALLAPNSYEWIITFWGIIASGNTAVLMNHELPQDLLLNQCREADVSIVCTEIDVLNMQPEKTSIKLLPLNAIKCELPYSHFEVQSRTQSENIVMMFTSGTTGASKIVPYTLDNIANSFSNLKETHARPGMEKVISILPFFHIAGLACIFQVAMNLHTLCLGRGAKYIFSDMPALNPTNISLVPSVLESIVKIYRMAKTPADQQRHLGKCLQRISVGGASLKVEVIRFMMAQGILIDSLYGMTETTGDGIRCILDDTHIGTIGTISGNMECRIQDGEILLKSPSIFNGYYNDPDKEMSIIQNGWLHTGDMGYCDKDGYYYITGRKKNVIILANGENVNPEEIEAQWGACEAIEECMVYSNGKGICADVYTTKPEIAGHFIKAYNENMPLYRQVYKINYTTTPLEKTGSGKIKRKANV